MQDNINSNKKISFILFVWTYYLQEYYIVVNYPTINNLHRNKTTSSIKQLHHITIQQLITIQTSVNSNPLSQI